eukprot:1136864-Pelagomonas_calceolata.AAC.10
MQLVMNSPCQTENCSQVPLVATAQLGSWIFQSAAPLPHRTFDNYPKCVENGAQAAKQAKHLQKARTSDGPVAIAYARGESVTN